MHAYCLRTVLGRSWDSIGNVAIVLSPIFPIVIRHHYTEAWEREMENHLSRWIRRRSQCLCTAFAVLSHCTVAVLSLHHCSTYAIILMHFNSKKSLQSCDACEYTAKAQPCNTTSTNAKALRMQSDITAVWDEAWWRHQMETFSALLAICVGIHRSPVNSPHKGQWRGALMFSLICVWINGWVNNHEAGD